MLIRFLCKVSPYRSGETAAMEDATARRLLRLGAAEAIEPPAVMVGTTDAPPQISTAAMDAPKRGKKKA